MKRGAGGPLADWDPAFDLDGSGSVDFPDFLMFSLGYGGSAEQ